MVTGQSSQEDGNVLDPNLWRSNEQESELSSTKDSRERNTRLEAKAKHSRSPMAQAALLRPLTVQRVLSTAANSRHGCKQNDILAGSSKVDGLEDKVDQLDREIFRANTSREQFLSIIRVLPDLPGKAEEEENMRQNESNRKRSRQALRCKETYDELLHTERRNLKFSRDKIQEVFRRVLSESRLLQVEENSTEMEEKIPKVLILDLSIQSSRRIAGESDQHRRAKPQSNLGRARVNAAILPFAQGPIRWSKLSMTTNCMIINAPWRKDLQTPAERVRSIAHPRYGGLTRALIDAEAAYEDVLTRARALRIIGNDFDQESDFVDHADDGYRESFEADMAAGADRFLFTSGWR
jgi:hypothetical protein